MKKQKEPRGIVFIITKEQKFLLQLRDEHSLRDPNKWVFPGGRSDKGEDEVATVIREAKEETDLDLQQKDCTLIMKRFAGQNSVYVCTLKQNQKLKVNEGAAFEWMTLDEVNQLELGYDQDDIVPVLKRYIALISLDQ